MVKLHDLFFVVLICTLSLSFSAYAQDTAEPASSKKDSLKESNWKSNVETKIRKKRNVKRRQKAKPSISTWISESLSPSGSVRFTGFQRDKYYSGSGGTAVPSLWLKLQPDLSDQFSIVAEGSYYAEYGSLQHREVWDLREMYLNYSWEALDIKIGRQVIVWGRADKINPTDSLSVKDARRLVVLDDDQRTGLFSGQFTLNLDRYRLIFVSQPEWREPNLPIPTPPEGIKLYSTSPDAAANQFGFKFDRTGDWLDFSVSYFSGIDRTPDLDVRLIGLPIELELQYNPIQVAGIDFAANVGSWGARGEIAYTKTRDEEATNPLIKNSFWFAVLGADRNFAEDTNINLQILYRSIDRWSGYENLDPLNASLAAEVDAISNQLDGSQFGLSARVAQKMFRQTLEFEMSVLYWAARGDYFYRPALNYAASDSLRISAGGEFYEGSATSYVGRLRPLSAAFAEFRFSF